METTEQKRTLEESFEALSRTVLRVADEHRAMRAVLGQIYARLENLYDVDCPIDGPAKEFPYSGAGYDMQIIRRVLDGIGKE